MQNKLTILLVDDSDGIKVCVKGSLRNGFDVHSVNTLTEAMCVLKNMHVDLVLLDLSLPDSKGLNSLDRIKNYYPQVPVIVLTAKEEVETARQAIAKGAQDYIFKSEFPVFTLDRTVLFAIERNAFSQRMLQITQTLDQHIMEVQNLIESSKNV